MIVVDGRTDYDKLVELLGFPEETHLDFKSKVDLALPVDRLKFVKDAVSMSNRPPGGYILVGVKDDGTPCLPVGTIPDRRKYDGAALDALVRGYIEGETHIRCQIHEHNDNEIVLIFIPHHRDGLPVPMSKDGQWEDPQTKKKRTEFRVGEVLIREGSANVALRHAHWADILSAYTERVRDQGATLAQDVLRALVEQLRPSEGASTPSSGSVPLLIEMQDSTFVDAAVLLIESHNDVRLRQFLRTLSRPIVSGTLAECEAAIDKWTILAAQLLHFERTELAEKAIDTLHDAYKKIPASSPDATRKRLAIVYRLYALGSLTVRLDSWSALRSLVLRRVLSPGHENYWYSSWIRQGQVEASRADLFTEGDVRAGALVSAARDLLVDHEEMHPDVDPVPPASEVGQDDALLNSLCQFDIAYCLVVAADGKDNGAYYPSSAALDESRAHPILEKIASDPTARADLFPNLGDAEIAEAIAAVQELAERESWNSGRGWWGLPYSAREYVETHRRGESQ
ncbi:AlbA family DNA-binding domain-containing protein [Nocardia testacea]|uniref:AlbA family DNA-binding domain-containing protein n=1 Tax=Nocardia testacea TaxID=248551 RepID=UPI0033E34CB9